MSAAKRKSKKQSDADYGKKPPEAITFFIDRALGKYKVVNLLIKNKNVLKNVDIEVKHLDSFFDQSTPDEVWLKFAGEKSWIVLTKDRQIRYRKSEIFMVKEYGVRMFTLTRGNWTGDQMAEIIVNSLPAIHNFIHKHHPPFIAAISKSGNIRRIDID